MKLLSYLILIATLLFNLILYYPETTIKLDPNDNIFQFALVKRTNEVWEKSNCPISLTCLPNLIDHWVPNWAEGYPLPYYYSHLPQITIVASYNLIVEPISSIFHFPFSIFHYYNWTKYLLFTLFPLSVYISLRLIGVNPLLSAAGAFFSTQLSTDGLYGIDPPSYLWRGYGLSSQLYATFFIPLAIAFTYKTLSENNWKLEIGNWKFILAILFTTLSIAGHLGIGMILLLTLPAFLFIDFNIPHILNRTKRLFIIIAVSIFLLSYWIIPAMLGNIYHLISFWDPVWKFNSWGFIDVTRQYFEGELYDWKRFPVVTILVTLGAFSLALKKKYFPFALSLLLWIFLYFGRATWNGLIDLLPGMKDFHQSRFIVGVHLAGLFLIPAGLEMITQFYQKLINKVISSFPQLKDKSSETTSKLVAFYSLIITTLILITFLTLKQTVDYAKLNNQWIKEANIAYDYEAKNYQNLLKKISQGKPGRVYAGRPGNWGREFRYSSTQLYLSVSLDNPISQFLPESWSPNSDNEQMFDERIPADYDLYNLRYIAAPPDKFTPPRQASLSGVFGPFQLYEIPTTGYFDIVTSNLMVHTKKTNFVNIVHVWQKSFARLWKMHPLISLEWEKPPTGIDRTITMTDLSNFEENGQEYNIFANHPFSFPEATVSGKIIKEEITPDEKYVARVEVPTNCKNCFTLFKMTYHPNWTVKLDGKSVEKYAVFPFFIAIPTSPGQHTLEFQYKPSNLKLLILFIEIIVILGFLFYRLRKTHRL
ncbi:YfhO family protein [Candidatus Gottesmanbacteria bacterium]|nr:YfhO family protein [Candidatus Gottesmanbacteria bacterium]